jgi:N-methylhydantoinase B
MTTEARTITIDPIRLELIKNSLDAIVDEMAIALMRSAYSPNIKTAMDMSTALCDVHGRLIAQGLTLPLHLGSIPDAIREVQKKFDGSIDPGDAFLLNDPYQGGTHLPDFYLFKPIFVGERLVGWSVSIGHQTDVGGRTAGGNGSDATEVYQEGIRIPPIKLFEGGKPANAIFELLAKNVRVPHLVLGDVRAQVAACLAGERGYLALIDRYGIDELAAASTALLDQSERLARNAISAMPDGVFSFTDYIDEDGLDPDPIPIVVTITVEGDHMLVDFDGTARQVRGAINSPFPFTKSAVYACVRHLIGGDPPNNARYFRPIEVRAPAGTLVNPVLPASVAARGLTGFRMANAVFGALARIAPDRVFACEAGGDTGISYGGYDKDRKPFVFIEFLYGGWGGRPDRDGVDGCSSSVVNFSNNPIEIVESEQPLVIRQYGYVPDTGGAGTFRGALAMVRDYEFEADEANFQLRTDRRRFVPYGLNGGRDGTPSTNILDPDGAAEELPTKVRLVVHRGDVLRHRVAGAGGWGDPLERDPARVLHDVREEKLTAGYVAREYGVVIDEASLSVDEAATVELRARLRAERVD